MLGVLVVLQVGIALPLIAGPSRRTVGLSRAIDLFFASHAPWSLWLLAAAVWAPSPLGRPLMPMLVSAPVPLVLTIRMIDVYFREVLELDPRDARARTVLQQAVTWGIPLVLYGTAVAAWPRILEMIHDARAAPDAVGIVVAGVLPDDLATPAAAPRPAPNETISSSSPADFHVHSFPGRRQPGAVGPRGRSGAARSRRHCADQSQHGCSGW